MRLVEWFIWVSKARVSFLKFVVKYLTNIINILYNLIPSPHVLLWRSYVSVSLLVSISMLHRIPPKVEFFGFRISFWTTCSVEYWPESNQSSFSDVRENPRVLLTHIPLYRPDETPCGPHRSSEIINQVLVASLYDSCLSSFAALLPAV